MILSGLANANEYSLITDQNTPGGYRLIDHANSVTSMNKIKEGSWDFVVLQAQSQEPSWPIGQMEVEVFPYAKILSDTIKAYNPCAEILFFETWGRKNGDQQNCQVWPPVCSFEEMNDRLLAGYYMMTEQNEASISPVGIAWRMAREDGMMNEIDLFSSDGSHPSPYGSYLSACVIYYSIFKEPVNASFYNGLEEDKALYLQSVANSIFSEDFEYIFEDEYSNNTFVMNRDNYFIYGQSVLANFDYTISGNEVSFFNQSVNETAVKWFFDDESTSEEENPEHHFDSGIFDVKLIASNTCFSDSVVHSIGVITGINTLNDSHVTIKVINHQSVVFEGLEDVIRVEVFNNLGMFLGKYSTVERNRLEVHQSSNIPIIVRFTDAYGGSFSKKIIL
ncbi:MAG: hypothetical protein CSA95_04775 [Bacteroidetes bacterium]|nr:MAG: hypothetical protein CSA95_04775 [Bacteroidota bacterium]